MPRFDGTGPLGFGPGTGRGLGPCGGGLGWRRGWRGSWWRGLGRRIRGRFFGGYVYQPQLTQEQEKELLNEGLKDLEEEMKEIKNRLAELEGKE